MIHLISPKFLDIERISQILDNNEELKLSDESRKAIEQCRIYLDKKIKNNDGPIYGINTGFGSLYNISISNDNIETLQENLIKSHACGMGDYVPKEIVRIILLLKIQSLSYGHSGVSIELVERLIDMYNSNILPVLYTQGSLGASGDLAPLAHLSLPLIGLGEVYFDNNIVPTKEIFSAYNWKPIPLKSKEGLALLNGTQFMSGYGVFLALKSKKIKLRANQIAAMSLDAFDGRIDPFDQLIANLRPHTGHRYTSEFFRNQLDDSEIIKQPKIHVQDPYSFRCIPQVHGASSDLLDFFIKTIEIEINSVTDNPNIFPEADSIISGGNFHGQPLAMPLDFLTIALSEWASISERRIYLLMTGQRGLPAYLVANSGLNSGFMIAQYTAASIVSQSKQYTMPASSDSIVSSNGQEDHVSMGANAATKCYQVLKNTERVLAIEAMAACQALDFRKPLKTSTKNQVLYDQIRMQIPFIEKDIIMYEYMNRTNQILF